MAIPGVTMALSLIITVIFMVRNGTKMQQGNSLVMMEMEMNGHMTILGTLTIRTQKE